VTGAGADADRVDQGGEGNEQPGNGQSRPDGAADTQAAAEQPESCEGQLDETTDLADTL
jgi:hypothetical protein